MKALFTIYKRAYQRKYFKYAILAILFMLMDIMISLLIPYLSKSIIDIAIPNHDLTKVFEIGAIVVGIAIAAVFSTILNNITSQYLATGITADIRNELFNKIQELSLSNVDSITTGKLMTIISSDTSQIQQIMVMSFRVILRAPFTLIGAMVMAYITNQDLFVIVLIAVPVLAIAFVLIFRVASPRFKILQTKIDNLNTKLSETIGGAREVKAFVTALEEEQKFDVVNEDYNNATIKANKIIVIVHPVVVLVSNIAIGAILYFASVMISNNSKTVMAGTIMTYIAYIQQIIMSLTMISTISIIMSRAIVSSERIKALIDVKIDINNDIYAIHQDIKGQIEYRNVNFAYADEDGTTEGKTLNDINLIINPYEMIGVIGSTGSGKTSLVQLIPRMYDVTSGELLIDGMNVKQYHLKTLRKQISLVTQEAIIFEGTFATNIKQGNENATEEELKAAAKFAMATEFIENSIDGYNTHINQAGTNLSGGQKQRLSIARAIIRKPKILILDDSTSAVDAKTEFQIKSNLRTIKDMTVVIVAQKISSIIECDKIIVINNNGRIDGYGSHKELIKTSKVYQEIYASQYGENNER
jgi:ATP-binding cassette subfamily B protein